LGLAQQRFPSEQVVVIDSSSEDGTAELAAAEDYKVVRIDRREFNHGGTRQLALEYVPWAKFVVYLTQDAVLSRPDSIDLLLAAFEDTRVAAAYGRQLPRTVAGPIEAHARLFNYPELSEVRDLESRHKLGIRAAFLSNSFAAYRVSALAEVGGFPRNVILSEDAIVTAKFLLTGWKTAYVAEALVHHSHEFTIAQEFRRYFDIGVAHSRERWLRDLFGKPRGEGQRFVLSELKYLIRHNAALIPTAIVRNVAKGIGYKLGLREETLGTSWCRRLSYHRKFWDSPVERAREAQIALSRAQISGSHTS
jgi:rhamnosyltransferase